MLRSPALSLETWVQCVARIPACRMLAGLASSAEQQPAAAAFAAAAIFFALNRVPDCGPMLVAVMAAAQVVEKVHWQTMHPLPPYLCSNAITATSIASQSGVRMRGRKRRRRRQTRGRQRQRAACRAPGAAGANECCTAKLVSWVLYWAARGVGLLCEPLCACVLKAEKSSA